MLMLNLDMNKKIAMGIREDDIIEVIDGVIFRQLENMPFDRDGVHATGWEFWDEENQQWWNEYEDGVGRR